MYLQSTISSICNGMQIHPTGTAKIRRALTKKNGSAGAGIVLGGPCHGDIYNSDTTTFQVAYITTRSGDKVVKQRTTMLFGSPYTVVTYKTIWVEIPLLKTDSTGKKTALFVCVRCHVCSEDKYGTDEIMAKLTEVVADLLGEL